MRIVNSIIGILLGAFSYFIVQNLFIAIGVKLFDLFPLLDNCQGLVIVLLVTFLEITLACLILMMIKHSVLNEIKKAYSLIIMTVPCLAISVGYLYYNCDTLWTAIVYSEFVVVHVCILNFSLSYMKKHNLCRW